MKNNKPISDKKDIANRLNKFLQMLAQIKQNISHYLISMYLFMTTFLGKGLESSMFLSPVYDQEIIRTVQHLKNKMSTDCSDINMNMKKSTFRIVKPFSHSCNVSFSVQGVFPSKMKNAKVAQMFWHVTK